MPRAERQPNPVPLVRRFGQAFVDVAAWAAALTIVYLVYRNHTGARLSATDRAVVGAVVAATHLVTALLLGLYQGRFWYGSSREYIRVYAAEVAGAAGGVLVSLALGGGSPAIQAVALALPISLNLGQVARIVHWWRRRRNARPTDADNTERRGLHVAAWESGASQGAPA